MDVVQRSSFALTECHSLKFLHSNLWDETTDNPDSSSSLYILSSTLLLRHILGFTSTAAAFSRSKYLIRLVFITRVSPDFFWMLLHDFWSYFPDSETYLFHIWTFLKSKWCLQWICPFTPTIILFSQITVIKSMAPVEINDLKQREQETWLLWRPQGEICCVEIMVKGVWAVAP